MEYGSHSSRAVFVGNKSHQKLNFYKNLEANAQEEENHIARCFDMTATLFAEGGV